MAGNSEHIPDFQEFQRYHSGAMSPGEQHLFERQMLQDAALADAYEGFLAMQRGNVDPSAIHEALANQLEKRITGNAKRVFPLWTYGIAASLIVMFGVIWLIFLSDPKKEQVLMEATQKLPPKPSQQTKIEPAPEANTPPALTFKASKPQQQPSLKDEKTVAKDADVLIEEETENVAIATDESELVESAPAQSFEPGLAYSAKPNASVARSSSVRSDSLVRKNEVVMSEASSKRHSFVDPQHGKNLREELSPKPLMGWEAYNVYLQQSADSASLNGKVTVSFTVNADGSLSDFTARGDKNLQPDAIRIVRDGPLWVPVKRNGTSYALPASVTLYFKK
jgi:hypothetical protein